TLHVRLDGTTEGRDARPPKSPLHGRDLLQACSARRAGGQIVFILATLLRVRPRQQPLVPALDRRDLRTLPRATDAASHLRSLRATPAHDLLRRARSLPRAPRTRRAPRRGED